MEEVAEDMVVVMAITRVVTGVETREATMKDTEVDMEEDKVNYTIVQSPYDTRCYEWSSISVCKPAFILCGIASVRHPSWY